MKRIPVIKTIKVLFVLMLVAGCSNTSKIVKPIEKANDELGKTRTIGKERTYAVVSPQDDKKLKIPF